MLETSKTERKKLEWELKQARELIRKMISTEVTISELIGFLIDSCPNIKKVGMEAWSEQYANMGDFITVISYGSEMMDGELGYDFNNDERVVVRNENK